MTQSSSQVLQRAAIVGLTLLVAPAAAEAEHATAEYVSAYGRARAYALVHPETGPPFPSCRKAIGIRATGALLERCSAVAGGTTHMYCTPRMSCEGILDRLVQYCSFWRGNLPCIYPEDGGAPRTSPTQDGTWRLPALGTDAPGRNTP